jgi:general secretion pathway protein A
MAVNNVNAYGPEWHSAKLARLDLVEDPFQLSANPRYLYLGDEHLVVYRNIQGVIARRRGLALVTGMPGTGKSSLARHIYNQLYGQKNVDIAYIDTGNFSSRMDAARTVSRAFNKIDVPSARSYSEQMENFKKEIVTVYGQGRNVVLLLDDAQLLTRQGMVMIQELYNFDFNEKAVTVVAFGQDEVVNNFRKYPAINSRIYIVQTLARISFATALQMVEFRLRVAGRSQPLFTDEAFSLVYELSDGIPREVVRICSLAVDRLIAEELDQVSLDVMREVAVQDEKQFREEKQVALLREAGPAPEPKKKKVKARA